MSAIPLLASRLARLADLSVGVVHHPQSNLSDFYRELGDIFGATGILCGSAAARSRPSIYLITEAVLKGEMKRNSCTNRS